LHIKFEFKYLEIKMSDNYSDSFDDGSDRAKTGGKNQDPIH
jgi:hypothetical protein